MSNNIFLFVLLKSVSDRITVLLVTIKMIFCKQMTVEQSMRNLVRQAEETQRPEGSRKHNTPNAIFDEEVCI